MKKIFAVSPFILAAALAFSACGLQNQNASPAAPETVAADTQQEAAETPEQKEVQAVTIAFRSNPTTGYSWTVADDDGIFEIDDCYTPDSETGMAGAGGTQTFTLVPKKTGVAQVDFNYERSWEHNSEASRSYLFEVGPDMQIRFVGVTGHDAQGVSGDVPFEVPQICSIPCANS